MLYEWRIRSRLLYWYGQLKGLERQMAAAQRAGTSGENGRHEFRTMLDRIDEAVSTIPVPLHYSDRLYELRGAIDLVRQRVEARG